MRGRNWGSRELNIFTNNDPMVAELTGPDGVFALETRNLRERPVRILKNHPHTIGEIIRVAEGHRDADLIFDRGVIYKTGQVLDQAGALAHTLQRRFNVGKGTRVAVAMSNRIEWMPSFLAIAALGGIPVVVNSRGSAEELNHAIQSLRCELVIIDRDRMALLLELVPDPVCPLIAIEADPTLLRPGQDLSWNEAVDGAGTHVLPVVETMPDDPAIVLFTSGTTGFPKGALLSQMAVTHGVGLARLMGHLNDLQYEQEFGTKVDPARGANRSPTIIAGPLFHVGGVMPFLRCLLTGVMAILLPKWNPEQVLEIIERHGVSRIAFGPTMYWDLLRSPLAGPANLGRIRFIASGTAPVAPSLLMELRKRIPYGLLSNTYGSTETMGYGASIWGQELIEHPTACGHVAPSVEIRLVNDNGIDTGIGEPGEIYIRSAAVMDGYLERPSETSECFADGWLRTGDVGQMNEKQLLHIVGRKKQMIISGGENIYVAEVERVLSDMPDVLEVLAFGVPDARLGERLAVAIVKQPGANLNDRDVVEFAKKQLAVYKAPRIVLFRSEPFPRTATGKLDRTRVVPALVEAIV